MRFFRVSTLSEFHILQSSPLYPNSFSHKCGSDCAKLETTCRRVFICNIKNFEVVQKFRKLINFSHLNCNSCLPHSDFSCYSVSSPSTQFEKTKKSIHVFRLKRICRICFFQNLKKHFNT